MNPPPVPQERPQNGPDRRAPPPGQRFFFVDFRRIPTLPGVSTERPWKIEAVIMLGAGLMICISAGTFANLGLKAVLSDLTPAQQRFAGFLMSAASFQIAGLFLVHRFLRTHEMTWREFLGLADRQFTRAIAIGVGVTIIALPIALALNAASEWVLTKLQGSAAVQPTIEALGATEGVFQRTIFAFAAIILAPLIEETLFRGILYRTGQQLGYPRLALFGSSFLFALIHASMMTLVPLTVLAIIFAKLYDHTNRLIAPIVAHALFNSMNLIGYFHREDIERWLKQLT